MSESFTDTASFIIAVDHSFLVLDARNQACRQLLASRHPMNKVSMSLLSWTVVSFSTFSPPPSRPRLCLSLAEESLSRGGGCGNSSSQ